MEPTWTIESLLKRGAFLPGLALELVRDAERAQDVVQDTWLQALEHPPRDRTRPRAWLATVLRNRVRQVWRKEANRGRTEALEETPDPGAAADELVERAQAQRRLVGALLELDTLYRTPLLMRYFDELDVSAIARRLRVPESTVRTRLHRGIGVLRSRLEARYGDEARTWLSALAIGAPRPASVPAGRAWFPTFVAAAVLFPLMLFVPWRVRDTSPSEPTLARADSAAERSATELIAGASPGRDDAERTDRVEDRAAETEEARAPEDRPSAATTPPRSRVVRVRVHGAPATQGEVFLSSTGWVPEDTGSVEPYWREVVGLDGRAVFADLEREPAEPRTVAVRLPTGGLLQKQLTGPRRGEVVLDLGSARVDARLWDTDGSPAASTRVMLGIKVGWDYGALTALRVTDSTGRFAVDHLPAESFWVHAVLPSGQEVRVHGALDAGETRTLELGSSLAQVEFRATLRASTGEPHVGAAPWLGGRIEFSRTTGDGNEVRVFEVDADGELGGEVAVGDYQVVAMVHGSSTRVRLDPVSLDGGEPIDLYLTGVRLVVRVNHRTTGKPYDPAQHGVLALGLSSVAERGETRRAGCRSDGVVVFDGLTAGSWRLEGERLTVVREVLVEPAEGTLLIDVEVD